MCFTAICKSTFTAFHVVNSEKSSNSRIFFHFFWKFSKKIFHSQNNCVNAAKWREKNVRCTLFDNNWDTMSAFTVVWSFEWQPKITDCKTYSSGAALHISNAWNGIKKTKQIHNTSTSKSFWFLFRLKAVTYMSIFVWWNHIRTLWLLSVFFMVHFTWLHIQTLQSPPKRVTAAMEVCSVYCSEHNAY